MKIEITAVKDGAYQEINLPATYSQLEDLLQQIDSDGEVNVRGRYYDEFNANTTTFNYYDCNIFEMNYLAEIIKGFNDEQASKFVGAFHLLDIKKVSKSEEHLSLQDTINIVLNVQSNNIIDYQPARDEQDLAAFHLENDLIPELEEVSDDAYQWIIDHTNLVELGEEICERENGTFISGQYITISKELEDLYDGSFRMPIKEDYVFKMEVGIKDETEDSSRVTITLPTNNETFRQLMRDFGVTDLTELRDYKFESVIPLLDPMDFGMADMETLNQLATSIQYFKEIGEFNTYKAMVDALDVIYLDRVNDLCDYVGEFTLVEKAKTYAEYGRSKFQNVLPDELLECLNTEDYGRKLAEKNGVTLTAYGALVPNDRVPLLEKIAKTEPKQDFGMTME